MDLAIGSILGTDAATGSCFRDGRVSSSWSTVEILSAVWGILGWDDVSYLEWAERWLLEVILTLGSES